MTKILHQGFEAINAFYTRLDADLSHYENSNDVCTPLGCVKEMVDVIPAEVWHRRNLKILDSCCGNGNFHAYIQKKTSTNNLYFNEINEIRVKNVKEIFGSNIHLTTQDFLTFDDKEEFDMVVSNPPYAKFNHGKRVSKNHNMSRDFIRKALSITKKGGYILFICPNNWMSFSDRNDLPRLLSQHQFLHLNISEAKKWFPKIGSSFTWFLLRKSQNKTPFTVKNNYVLKDSQEVTLDQNANFIPLYYSNTVRNIFNKTVNSNGLKYAIQTSSDLHRYTKQSLLSEHKDDEHPYKLVHTPKQVVWSKRPHKYQETWKVFISLTDKYRCFVDQCGSTQSVAFVQCKSEKEAYKVKVDLESEVFLFLNNVTRYGNFNNVRVLQNFPLLEAIDLTKDEREFVKRFNDSFYKR